MSTQTKDLAYERALVEVERLSRAMRKRPLVVFFGRLDFSDNSKYAYLAAVARERDYDVLWATPSPALVERLTEAGLPVLDLAADPEAAVSTLLRAAVAVQCVNMNESTRFQRVFAAAVAGATQVQLWHGVSAKHLVLQLIGHLPVLDPALRETWTLNTRADLVLSTSEELDGYWREVFGCRRLLRAGLPRNEVLTRAPSQNELIGAELPAAASSALLRPGRRKLLVVPTWQRTSAVTLTDANTLGQIGLWAQSAKVDLFLKLHPMYAASFAMDKDTFGPNCYILPPGADVYPWLRLFDGLVTDYSSIMFDFLLTGRPVARLDLARGDLHTFEPDFSLVPGGVDFAYAFTPATVRTVLDRMFRTDPLAPARAAAAARLFPTDSGSACDDVLAVIDDLVAEAAAPDWVVVN